MILLEIFCIFPREKFIIKKNMEQAKTTDVKTNPLEWHSAADVRSYMELDPTIEEIGEKIRFVLKEFINLIS